jgi:3-polyprenyl-4-hydroxybenzoate decarboxylase
MAKDLRSFLQDVRRTDPSQLIKIKDDVSCKYDVIALSDLSRRKKSFPCSSMRMFGT